MLKIKDFWPIKIDNTYQHPFNQKWSHGVNISFTIKISHWFQKNLVSERQQTQISLFYLFDLVIYHFQTICFVQKFLSFQKYLEHQQRQTIELQILEMGKKITAKKENKFSAKRQAFKQSNKEMLDILKQLQQHQRVTVKLKTKPIRKNSQKPSANVEESKTRKEIEQQVVRMMMNVLGKVRYKQIIPQTSTVRVLVQIRLEEALICMFEFFRVKRFENYPRDNFIRGLIHILVGQRKILFTKKVREWVRKQKLGKNERKLLYRKVFAKVMEIRHRSTVALSFLSVVILILQRSTVMVRSDEKNIEICQGIYRLFEEAFSKQFLQKMYYRQTSYTEFEELLQKYKSNILNSFPQFPQQGQFQYYLTCLQNAIKGEFQQKNDNERKRTATDLNKITKESKLSETLEKSDENEQIMVLQLQKKNSYEYLFDQDSKKFRVHQTPFCDQISNNKDNYSNRSE